MLSAIVAVSYNNVIGSNNKLLWSLPKDLHRFKKITEGHIIIMGRKTFESLPKVLPNRKHIVLTRDKNYKILDDSVTVINSVNQLHNVIREKEEAFVIGGGEIYSLLLPYTDKIYLTKINKTFEGDTYFPKLNSEEWNLEYEEKGNDSEFDYKFINLKRNFNK